MTENAQPIATETNTNPKVEKELATYRNYAGEVREDEDLPSLDSPRIVDDFLNDIHRYILPSENAEEFVDMYEALESHFKTKNIPEYFLLLDCAALVWEISRYRRMKIAIVEMRQRPAVELLFRKIYSGNEFHPLMIDAEVRTKVEKYFSDAAFRTAAIKLFEMSGLPPDAVEIEAFQNSLGTLAKIEQLIASAQKRLANFTKDLERRYAERGARLRRAARAAKSGES